MKMKRTKRMKITALLLTLVLLLCNFPIPIFSVESGAQGAKDSTIPAQTVADSVMENPDAEQDTEGKIFEIVSRREKNVKHFRMPDGTVRAVVYGASVHRKDANGAWQDINNNLSANVSKVKNAYATDDLRLIFAKQYLPNEQLFVLNEDGYSVAMKLMGSPLSTQTGLLTQGATSVTTVTNAPTREANATYRTIEEAQTVRNASTITYTNVRANTDLEYVLTGDSVKENIVVKQAGGSYTYDFALTLSGLTATLRADGSVQLSDAETETEQYVIPAPYMYDANGNYSWDVSYTLTQTGEGTYRLTVIADPDWINAEGRAFPVTVDPTIKREVLYDTYVDFYHPDTNYGGVENIILGEHTVVYIRAVMPSLPENATFSWAKLFLYYHYYDYVTSGSLTAGVYRMIYPWAEYGLTWNVANQNANMGLDTVCLDTAELTPHSNPNLAAAFDVTALVGNWLAGETNYGLGVKYLSGTNGSVFLNSYESSTNNCPFFQISYSEPAIAGGVYKIKSNYNGLYLDVANGGIAPGTAVVQWPGTDTDNKQNQLFKIAHIGTDSTSTQQNYYSIRSMMNSATGVDICPEDTQYPVPTNQRIIVNSVPTSDQMHQYSSTNKWYLIYDKDRNAYTICNGPQAQTRYLSVLGSSTHGAQISTTNTLDASCYWTLIPYTGAEINDVVIDAFPRRMVESQSFDFNAYMYSSVVGRNGPIVYGVANEDYSPSNKATIDASTGVVTMHSAGLVRISVTFDGSPYIWYYNIIVEPLLNGTYFFKNDEYGKYMQINNNANVSDVGAFFELWDFDGDDDQRWTVTYVGDGYYMITSVASGLAVTAPSEEDQNFTQTAYVGAMTQQFQITETGSGTYNIIPRSSSYYLSVGDGIFTSDGRNVELRRSQGGVENEWYIQTGNVFLEFSYDMGFIQRNQINSETTDSTKSRIENNIANDYFPMLAKAFAEKCKVYFMFSSVSNYVSDADNCSYAGIDTNCDCIAQNFCVLEYDHNPYQNNATNGFQHSSHCKSMIRLRNNMVVNIPDNTIRVTYTGHTACFYSSSGGHNYSTIGLADYDYPIVCIREAQNENRDRSILVLAHEISHTYGAQHHDYNGVPCIMSSNRYQGNKPQDPDTYWCDDCIETIRSNNNAY